MTLRFGTDGVRGVAGGDLTPELALALGRAAARVLGPRAFVVGRDTRWSGPLLQAAFSAGVGAEGTDVIDLGVAPTPAVAAVAADRDLPAAVISASHNPYADNGVKLFSAGGRKLTDEQERAVEAALPAAPTPGISGDVLGRLSPDPLALEWYCEGVVGALEDRRLGGIRVAIDCANGAACVTAARVLRSAGADVVAEIGARPDGRNINAGFGSTTPGPLSAAVLEAGAAVGLAFDGDADRVIATDDGGRVIDGDHLLALFATDLMSQGRLAGSTVVVTEMTNLGFHRAMADAGVKVHQTPVGDRHVLSALDANGWSLGGEQSGHIIFRDRATTGDGVLAGLLLLDLVARRGSTLGELAGEAMVSLPQVLRNVQVGRVADLAGAAPVWDAVAAVQSELGSGGRVLLRPSGTEPLVRVMVEASSIGEAEVAADRLARAVEAALR